MTADSTSHVTALLNRWQGGEPDALDELVPAVYAELRRLARAQLSREHRPSIQPTELVAEAYMRLVDIDAVDWQGRVGLALRSPALARRPSCRA